MGEGGRGARREGGGWRRRGRARGRQELERLTFLPGWTAGDWQDVSATSTISYFLTVVAALLSSLPTFLPLPLPPSLHTYLLLFASLFSYYAFPCWNLLFFSLYSFVCLSTLKLFSLSILAIPFSYRFFLSSYLLLLPSIIFRSLISALLSLYLLLLFFLFLLQNDFTLSKYSSF